MARGSVDRFNYRSRRWTSHLCCCTRCAFTRLSCALVSATDASSYSEVW